MSYEIKFDESSSRHFVEVKNEPSYHHVLNERHLKDEAALREGAWLVTLVTPNSVQSKINLEYMRKAVNKFEGFVRFGVRLFDDNNQMANWCPEANLGVADPVTVILLDGKLLWSAVGVVGWEQIQEAAREFLYDHIEKAYKASGRREPIPWFSPEWAMYMAYLAIAYFLFMSFTFEEWKYGQIGILLLCPGGVWLDFSILASDWELDRMDQLILLMKRSIVALILTAPMLVSFYKQWL